MILGFSISTDKGTHRGVVDLGGPDVARGFLAKEFKVEPEKIHFEEIEDILAIEYDGIALLSNVQ